MGIPSRPWASIPRSEMIVLDSQHGVLVVAHGMKRLNRLLQHDVILQACLPTATRLLTLPGVSSKGMRELSRALCMHFADTLVWPQRGEIRTPGRVGAVKDGQVVATEISVSRLARRVGITTPAGRNRLADTWLTGSKYRRFELCFTQSPL